MTDESIQRLETKVDTMLAIVNDPIHKEHHEYLSRVLAREARRARFQEAVIEKTLASLIWSGIAGSGIYFWSVLKDHWK